MPKLFDPIAIRGVTYRNRVFVSPMCQYSSADGMPNDWHLVHLGSRAVGGAGLVMVEASGVSPSARITDWDSGIWSEEHAAAFRPIVDFIHAQGSVAGIQLAHAGRKASTERPWDGGKYIESGPHSWTPVAPTAIPFRDEPPPHALTVEEIAGVVGDFVRATELALSAGFRTIEIHAAHGYLLHQFLSPLSNQRTDEFGGSLENRMRFPLQVATAIRQAMPDSIPLFVRISATEWVEGGWNIDDSVALAIRLREIGVDLIDCSSGGTVPNAKIPTGPGYQVPFAREVRTRAAIATAAVGLITEPEQAEAIIAEGSADAVLLARAMLRDPYWPLHAAQVLGATATWPDQYLRGRL